VIQFRTRGRLAVRDGQPGFGAGLVRDPVYYIAGSTYEQPDFHAIPATGLIGARNCRITVQGALQKLHGTRRVHASAIGSSAAVLGGFAWKRGNGTVPLLTTAGGTFYTGAYAMPMTWTAQAGALSAVQYPSFASFRDGSGEAVYIADGGLLNKWNGAALTMDIASTPAVGQLAVYNQRLFGVSGADENLYWSGLNNGDTLGIAASGGGVAVIRTFGGQRITALAPVGGSLLLFHANAISRFSGYSQSDIDIDAGAIGHAAEVGTLAPRSVVVINDEGQDVALFLSKRGLFGATETAVVAIPTPFDRELSSLGAANWTNVHAVHNPVNREVWFNVTGFIYIYNYAQKAWTGPCTQMLGAAGAPVSLWAAENDLGGPIVLAGGVDGFVRHCDYASPPAKLDLLSDGSGGSTNTMAVALRPFFFGDEPLDKSFRHLYITGQSLGASASLTIDFTTSNGDSGSVSVTLTTTADTVSVPLWGTGTYIKITITDQSTSPTLLYAVRADAFALGSRR
jgi:hypothetical protein